MRRKSTNWLKTISLTGVALLLGIPLLVVSYAAEGDPEFGDLKKGADGRYHWKEEKEDAAITSGKVAFAKYCASCHNTDAKGEGPMAAVLKDKPADLTRIAQKNGGEFPLWETYRTIDGRRALEAHGGSEMPVWGDEFMEEDMSEKLFGKQAYRRVAEQEAESSVKDRILGLVLYIQSIQE